MVKVIGVRFRTAGKIYFFDPLEFPVHKGDHVIVETARGIEFGTVVNGITDVAEDKVVQPLKPVIRIANQRDIEQEASNREKEKEAFRICLEKIRSHGLEMKLIDAEYTFDNNKVLFYFTADGRIDFRELVKDLAGVFKTRIELRQIGVRDETKIVGGIGICGRSLCCHSYLSDFVPVSIKMAKEQNLSLNPAKISGVCGRLMCCLKNEEETYEELNKRLPNIGDYVTLEEGLKGEVHSVNVLRQLVKVVVDVGDEKEIKEYPVEKLHFRRKHGKKEKVELSREEMQELERLEEEEQQKQSIAGKAQAEENVKAETDQRQGGRNRHRQGGGQRQGGREEENRRMGQKQHSGEEQKQQGPRQEEGRRQKNHGVLKQQAHMEAAQERQEQSGEEGPGAGRHQNGKVHRDNRKRQDKGRQGGQRQEGGEAQNGRNRYDNRNRHDRKPGQDEQPRPKDGQS